MAIKKVINLVAAFLLVFTVPATALADDPNGPNCAIPLASLPTNGVSSPTGADASTYSYNCTTGVWENTYYTWSPVTHVTTPKYSQAYAYNPVSGMWESTTWTYSPSQGKFYSTISSLSYDPYAPPLPAPSTISNTGPDSTNKINNDPGNNNLNLSTNSNAQLSNNLTQGATTGDINVNANTTAGNATSGNALNATDVINMLQSSWGLQPAPNVQTFTANIQGDVNGNLLINPGALGSQNTAACGCAPNTNLTVNAKTTGSIDNTINSTANSGNVNVTQNTTAGNATSGTATAVANVVNLLNSMISAGQSFIGVVNINGNMNGNIYIPNDLVSQLLADNIPSTTLDVGNSSLNANLTNNQAITNNITSAATSGSTTLSENTKVGNATSGNASNTVRVFNLTGRQIVDANTLLVFINVAGQWVGFLMDASQTGATAAALGGGVTQNCASCGGNNNTNINATNTGTITNNINLAANSGNVNASQNTTVGNATSGNARTAANLLNINNSGLSSSGWFGILFINILGNWHGNFCANTSTPGCELATPGMGGGSSGTSAGLQVFRFVPSSISNTGPGSRNFILNRGVVGPSSINNTGPNSKNVIISASTKGPKINGPSSGTSKWIVPLVSTVVGLALVGSEQIAAFGRRHNLSRQLKVGFGQAAHSLRILLF